VVTFVCTTEPGHLRGYVAVNVTHRGVYINGAIEARTLSKHSYPINARRNGGMTDEWVFDPAVRIYELNKPMLNDLIELYQAASTKYTQEISKLQSHVDSLDHDIARLAALMSEAAE
jgi:hypothetical protein